jgi:hypothetical protein
VNPPTVAQPSNKKRFSFPKPSALMARRQKDDDAVESSSGKAALFAFRRSSNAPPAPPEASVAPAPAAESTLVPVVERLKLKCPSCAQAFTAEGVRPFTATCSNCGFVAEVTA